MENYKITMFTTPTCGACKAMTPILINLYETDGIEFDIIDIITHPDGSKLIEKHNIFTVPTLVFSKDGIQFNRVEGFHTAEDLKELCFSNKSEDLQLLGKNK